MSDRIKTNYELHQEVHRLMCQVFESMTRRLTKQIHHGLEVVPVLNSEKAVENELPPVGEASEEVSECQS